MSLTDKAIRAAIARSKAAKLFDGGGLYLLIRPQHAPPEALQAPQGKERKSKVSARWRHKFYFAGVEKLVSHGVYPHVSLKLARKRWADARQLLEDGTDPSAHRKAQKAARRKAASQTFEAVAREWFAKQSKKWAESNSAKIIGRLEKDAFPWIGQTPISDLKLEKLLETLQRIEERGAIESAHRMRQSIDAIFEYAMAQGLLVGNPTPAAKALTPVKKGKFASITEPRAVGALIRALRQYQGSLVTRIALQLAPLVFVRPGELRAAEWAEFDLDAAEWRIPAQRMKMKSEHIVPLSKQALALLKELKPLTGHGGLVFPSERSPFRPMSENTLTAALRVLGYAKEQMSVHGFRHMASTLLNEHGWNRDAIERQMAHMPRDQVRAAYNAAQYLAERRKMMQWWADRLNALAAANGNVVGIHGARK